MTPQAAIKAESVAEEIEEEGEQELSEYELMLDFISLSRPGAFWKADIFDFSNTKAAAFLEECQEVSWLEDETGSEFDYEAYSILLETVIRRIWPEFLVMLHVALGSWMTERHWNQTDRDKGISSLYDADAKKALVLDMIREEDRPAWIKDSLKQVWTDAALERLEQMITLVPDTMKEVFASYHNALAMELYRVED